MNSSIDSILELLPSPPKLLTLDFDGVLTDNLVIVGQDGTESVRCSREDSMGIALVRKVGIPVWVLSTETNPVVRARCEKLQIDCEQGCNSKDEVFLELLRRYGIDAADAVFVGNDVNDVNCLKLAGCGVVVADAHDSAKSVANFVLSRPGGRGAVRELCDLLLHKIGFSYEQFDYDRAA